jgi:hypothetical protein
MAGTSQEIKDRPKMKSSHFGTTEHCESGHWFSALIVLSILTIGVAGMSNNVADTDLWGHIQYGREVLADGRLPQTSTWTYAVEGVPWINHENLAELWLAYAYDNFGIWGLTLSRLLISLTICGLMIWSGRIAKAGWLAIGLSVFIASKLMCLHWHFRPQVMTYLAFAILLIMWQYVFASWSEVLAGDSLALQEYRRRKRWMWCLPILFCLWANAHGGFVAGLVVMAVYLGIRFVELGRWLSRFERPPFWKSWDLWQLFLVGLGSVAATLINPYGLELWRFMWMALRLPRTEILDFQPLPWFSTAALMVWIIVSVVIAGLVRGGRRPDLAQICLLGLILWQGLSHIRHIVIFAILAGFWLPAYLQPLIDWLVQRSRESRFACWLLPSLFQTRSQSRPLVVAGLSAVVFACCLRTLPDLRCVAVERNEYPVSALQFMEDNGLQGKTLVSFNWGQYVLGYFATKQNGLIAIDGRYETCYPREIIDQYFDFMLGQPDPRRRFRSPTTPAFDPEWALRHEQPDLVLIEADSFGVTLLESHRRDWVLLYRDSLAQLWGRRKKYDDPNSPNFVRPLSRRTDQVVQTGRVCWPAFPVPRQRPVNPDRIVSSDF